MTSTWLVSFTRATLRRAEFGFFGVVVYTRVHTPRRCGLPLRAAVLTLAILSRRPLRTSWLMVGIYRLPVLRFVFFSVVQVCVLQFLPRHDPRDRACRTQWAPRKSTAIPHAQIVRIGPARAPASVLTCSRMRAWQPGKVRQYQPGQRRPKPVF